MCFYNDTDHQLVLHFVGHTKTLDEAKASLQSIRKRLLPRLFKMVDQGLGIHIGKTDYRLVWDTVADGKRKTVITWNHGQYVLP